MANEILAKMSEPEGRSDGVGVDHQMVLIYRFPVDEETILEFQLDHKTVTIPLADMKAIRDASTQNRSAVYKAAIEDNWYLVPVPTDLTPPRLTEDENGDIDYTAFDDWVDNVMIPWRTDVEDCQTLATLAKNYVEGLDNFSVWPYEFVLRS